MITSNERVESTLKTQIHNDSLELPLLPAVANQVIQLASHAESSSMALAQLLQQDPALAGNTMRLVNSAAYAAANKIVSLQQAITRLGMQTITEIALASSLNTKLFNAPGYEQHIIKIWRHALATALWSKELARFNRSNTETVFLAGLLHSIGRPVVLQAVLKIASDLNTPLSEKEVAALENLYQQEAGLKICERWQMPELIFETIKFLPNPMEAPHHWTQIAIINGATNLAYHMLYPDELNQEQLHQLEIFGRLNLYQDEIDQLLTKTNTISTILEAMTY